MLCFFAGFRMIFEASCSERGIRTGRLFAINASAAMSARSRANFRTEAGSHSFSTISAQLFFDLTIGYQNIEKNPHHQAALHQLLTRIACRLNKKVLDTNIYCV